MDKEKEGIVLKVTYYKDFRHNFLVIHESEYQGNNYQCRMITENRIQGLLPCRRRHVNGEMLLYYEISSKQNLESIFEHRKITMKHLQKLFLQLKLAWNGLSRFLLNESCLVLKPEYIFGDIEAEEFSFLYYPFEPEESYLKILLEYLTDNVDNEDRAAVEAVYKLFELVENEQFVLDEVLQWFDRDYGEQDKAESKAESKNCSRLYGEGEAEARGRTHEESEETGEFPDRIILPGGNKETRESREAHREAGGYKLPFAGLILGAFAGGILFYIYQNYHMETEWLRYFYIAAVVSGVIFAASGLWLLYLKCVFGRGELGGRLQDIWEREKDTGKEVYQNTDVYENMKQREEQVCGDTVFIPWVENCENKLYGVGRENKNHIDLKTLPLTVGKLAGCVDMVITDRSISRKHARFEREGNRIYMTDLNSTNGSFKNGLRLEPNASEILEPGDEIRLGKLKFIYR